MKKVLSLLMLLAVLLCCVTASAQTAEEEKNFSILLTGNPTTGYDWVYVLSEEGLATVEEEFLTSADVDRIAGIEPVAEPMAGEGGLYHYTVKGVKPGKLLLAFEYARSWEEDSTVAGLTYALTVNEDLSVVCTASALGM